jgi:hypothetical protein
LVERDQVFLVGRQQTVHALSGPRQIALQDFLPPLGRAGGSRGGQAAVEFSLDEAGILE